MRNLLRERWAIQRVVFKANSVVVFCFGNFVFKIYLFYFYWVFWKLNAVTPLAVVIVCCCFDHRVPRTREQIEDNYQKRLINAKYLRALERNPHGVIQEHRGIFILFKLFVFFLCYSFSLLPYFSLKVVWLLLIFIGYRRRLFPIEFYLGQSTWPPGRPGAHHA